MEEKIEQSAGQSLCKVRDLGEAAILYTLRKKFLELKKQDTSHVYWFIFEGDNDCETILQQYWSKELLINAKNFYDSLRTLKNILFDAKDRGRSPL